MIGFFSPANAKSHDPKLKSIMRPDLFRDIISYHGRFVIRLPLVMTELIVGDELAQDLAMDRQADTISQILDHCPRLATLDFTLPHTLSAAANKKLGDAFARL